MTIKHPPFEDLRCTTFLNLEILNRHAVDDLGVFFLRTSFAGSRIDTGTSKRVVCKIDD